MRKIIDPIVTGIFSAKDFNLNKNTPEAYIFIAQKINKEPEQIVYIDDTVANLDAARKAGMHILKYENTIDTIKALNLLFPFQ